VDCYLRFHVQAEVLGDRVAIMARGRLRCVGSALWLKARFGLGYRLVVTTTRAIGHATEETVLAGTSCAASSASTVAAAGTIFSAAEHKAEDASGTDEFGLFAPPKDGRLAAHSRALFSGSPKHAKGDGKFQFSRPGRAEQVQLLPKKVETPVEAVPVERSVLAATAAEAAVRQTVVSAIPAANFAGAVAREVTFRLPRSSAPAFPALLETLDQMPESVSAYSLAVTSLEEVFVQVAEEDEKDRARGDGGEDAGSDDEGHTGHLDGNHAAVEMVKRKSTGEVAAEGIGGPEDQLSGDEDEGRSDKNLDFFDEISIQVLKRWTIFKRDRKGAFFQLGVPIILIAGILSILTIRVTVSIFCRATYIIYLSIFLTV
jgi:hypothetical protein